MKISIVVAVYNPGGHLDDLVESIGWQTMPASEFEAIFVDDGSTDGSGERLDALAAQHPNFIVEHIPNSGWSGRPRNVGLDRAAGTYVYIVDHDDWLGEEALERLYQRAERTEADVLVAKEVGHGFAVPHRMFRRNVDEARLGREPLLALLTPHKLFRRSFLEQYGIRFPEGRVRLEDHNFMIQAYLQAKRIAILADYPCYHWVLRDDGGNSTHRPLQWPGYFQNVREILDIVDRHTSPGPERDRLYSHWYLKVITKLKAARFVGHLRPSANTRLLLQEMQQLAGERFGPHVERHLDARQRIIAGAMRAGVLDVIGRFAELSEGVHADVQVHSAAATGWQLDLSMTCGLAYADGTAFTFGMRGGRGYWPAPGTQLQGLELASQDVTDELAEVTVAIVMTHRASRVTYDALVAIPELRMRAGTVAGREPLEVSFDLSTVAAGRALAGGIWDLSVQVRACGWGGTRRLPAPEVPLAPAPGDIAPYVTRNDKLSIKVAEARSPVAVSLRQAIRRIVPRPVRLVLREAIDWVVLVRRR